MNECAECKQKVHHRLVVKMCNRCYHRKYAQSRSEERRLAENARNLKRTRELRAKVLEGLGNICRCCETTIKEFLCVDHIDGGGHQDRKKSNGSQQVYRRIITEGFPSDKYQLLCWNCNASFGMYGYCPHGRLPNREKRLGRKDHPASV